jgi:hypothetical protein
MISGGSNLCNACSSRAMSMNVGQRFLKYAKKEDFLTQGFCA